VGLMRDLFHRHDSANAEKEAAEILAQKTGDPAYMHQVNWSIAMGRNDFKTALQELNKALEIVPNNAYYLAIRAMTNYKLDNLPDTNSDLNSALIHNPSQKEAVDFQASLKKEAMECRDRARESSKSQNRRQSLVELDRACALEPDNAENFSFRGITLAQLGDLQRAIVDFKRTLQLKPQYPDALKVLETLERMAREAKG
jgi:tetratricopeptide (TPR) repeat protein